MVDIENQIYNTIATALRAQFNPIFVTGEYTATPSTFPCVSIVEQTNSQYVQTQDSGSLENHTRLMYEINVYSNKVSGKKSECKQIFNLIDNEFNKLGFTRTMKEPIPNLENATIYRMIGRYTAVVSKDERIYRR